MKLFNFNDSKKNNSKKTEGVSTRITHLIQDKTPFSIREAFKSTRTNIMFTLPNDGPKVIVVTSAWPLEGKTTTCANIGITFSQTGAKVLIVDADLRKPRMKKMFNIKSENGLSNFIRGFCNIEEATFPTAYENLYVVPSGHVPPNPTEMLSSKEMRDFVEYVGNNFDYVFIDTPPVNMVTDAALVSSLVMGTILVTRQALTDHPSIENALAKLKVVNATILGFILNDVDEEKNGYYRYGYRYSRGYYKNNYKNYKYYQNYKAYKSYKNYKTYESDDSSNT